MLLAVEGHVATITLNRPEQRNPLSGVMLRDLATAFRWCQHEPEVRVVVLTGAGDRAFCAGADLSSFDGEHDATSSATAAAIFSSSCSL